MFFFFVVCSITAFVIIVPVNTSSSVDGVSGLSQVSMSAVDIGMSKRVHVYNLYISYPPLDFYLVQALTNLRLISS
jgi:hypothetical protein